VNIHQILVFPPHPDTAKALKEMILDPNVKYLARCKTSGQRLEFWNGNERNNIRCVDPGDRGSGYLNWDYLTFITLHSDYVLIKI
jgi:hypothetical protein